VMSPRMIIIINAYHVLSIWQGPDMVAQT